MKTISFNSDTELEIVLSFDEKKDTIAAQGNETFRAGEKIHDVNILDSDTPDYCDIQFADGTLALTVLRSSFTIH